MTFPSLRDQVPLLPPYTITGQVCTEAVLPGQQCAPARIQGDQVQGLHGGHGRKVWLPLHAQNQAVRVILLLFWKQMHQVMRSSARAAQEQRVQTSGTLHAQNHSSNGEGVLTHSLLQSNLCN